MQANRYFSIKMSLSSNVNQAELIQRLKSRSGDDDVIQTADGLCLKTSLSESELSEFLKAEAGGNLALREIGTNTEKTSDLSPDVIAFIGGL